MIRGNRKLFYFLQFQFDAEVKGVNLLKAAYNVCIKKFLSRLFLFFAVPSEFKLVFSCIYILLLHRRETHMIDESMQQH
jgi:hypothetical protein